MAELSTVAAFARSPFGGNLAGVCLLEGAAPEGWMQAVAANVNRSETAFVHPEGGAWRLRWFMPTREVPLCGQATLATAHLLASRGHRGPLAFDTRSGRLTCVPAGSSARRGATATCSWRSPRSATSRRCGRTSRPLRVPGDWGFIATAPAADGEGYVCRYFAPAWGIDEDPATGSIQCTLGPYWAQRLGQPRLRCRQLSRRGAELWVEPKGDRVVVEGTAVLVTSGRLAEAALPPAVVRA